MMAHINRLEQQESFIAQEEQRLREQRQSLYMQGQELSQQIDDETVKFVPSYEYGMLLPNKPVVMNAPYPMAMPPSHPALS